MKYPEFVNVRLTKAQMDDLRQLAEDEEMSMSDIVRDLLIEHLDQPRLAN